MSRSEFRAKFLKEMEVRRSKIVLALDAPAEVDPITWSLSLLKEVDGYVAAVKVGLSTLLQCGISGMKAILKAWGGLSILDLKLADVAHVNRLLAGLAGEMGFDAIIAHGFVGYEGALDALVDQDLGVLVVAYMSHPGAEGTFEKVFDKILETVKLGEFDGAIVPATRPGVVRRARSALGRGYLLLAPGVGAQGARPGDAIAAGADAEIVGRAIYHPSPDGAGERARRIRDEAMEKANLRTSL